MDEHTLIKIQILDILNNYRKINGPTARKDLREVASDLSIDFDKFMKFYGNELFTDDFIYMDSGACAYIKSKGLSIIDKDNPFYNEYKKSDIKNININAPVTNSNIIQGDGNTINITNQYYDQIVKEIEKSNLQPREKSKWLKRVKEMSSHPIVSQIFIKSFESLLKNLPHLNI